jgi:hypothetical protein
MLYTNLVICETVIMHRNVAVDLIIWSPVHPHRLSFNIILGYIDLFDPSTGN